MALIKSIGRWIASHKRKSAIIGGAFVVVVGAAIALGLTVFAPKPVQEQVAEEVQVAPTPQVQAPKLPVVEAQPIYDEPYYILLMGADSRSRDLTGSRSDAIVLIRVDEKTPQLTLVSLPRDTLAAIPGYGDDKINAALAYGGRDLAEQAVEARLGVDIRYNALLGFNTTTDLVDYLGGVTIDVDANMSFQGVSVAMGLQTLDGTHALTFARCRKELARGDFHRVEHHRDLFIATFEKITSAQGSDYAALAAKILPYLETNIPADKAVQLLKIFKDYDSSNIYEATAPSTSGPYNGGSYVFLVEEEWVVMRERIDAGLPPLEQ